MKHLRKSKNQTLTYIVKYNQWHGCCQKVLGSISITAPLEGMKNKCKTYIGLYKNILNMKRFVSNNRETLTGAFSLPLQAK